MRVTTKPLSQYPWYIRPFFWKQKRKYGQVLEPGLVWGRSPRLFMGVAFLYGMIERRANPLAPALRSLVTVRVSQINHCRFCVDVNSATLMKRGIGEEKVAALEDWQNSNLFDARERAALAYTEAVTRSDQEPDDAIHAELSRHFDEDAVVELTGLIAFQNMSSKFNAALDVPPQGFCRLPQAGERPGGQAERAQAPDARALDALASDAQAPDAQAGETVRGATR